MSRRIPACPPLPPGQQTLFSPPRSHSSSKSMATPGCGAGVKVARSSRRAWKRRGSKTRPGRAARLHILRLSRQPAGWRRRPSPAADKMDVPARDERSRNIAEEEPTRPTTKKLKKRVERRENTCRKKTGRVCTAPGEERQQDVLTGSRYTSPLSADRSIDSPTPVRRRRPSAGPSIAPSWCVAPARQQEQVQPRSNFHVLIASGW